MVPVSWGKMGQTRTVKPDPVIMNQIWISLFTTGSHEDYAALLRVNADYSAHKPFSLGYLVLHPAGVAVIKPQMVPSVPL